ncbi:MAG TPA: hypothetical protein VGD96_20785 [Bradyrhizobium sp.]
MVAAKAGRRSARHRGFHPQRVTATGWSAPQGCLIAGRHANATNRKAVAKMAHQITDAMKKRRSRDIGKS